MMFEERQKQTQNHNVKNVNLFVKIILVGVITGIIILLLITIYVVFFDSKTTISTNEYILFVERGDTLYSVATKLERNGIIKNKKVFVVVGKLLGVDKLLVPSAYKLNSNMSVFEILQTIIQQKIYTIRVLIREGYTMYHIDKVFAEVGFTKQGEIINIVTNLSFVKRYNVNLDRLEGFLFPATYDVPFYYKGKPDKIVEMMVNTFFKKINRVEYEIKASKVGLTFEQAVILASIIEKEARTQEEKYLVSSVFHNRLKKGMKFDSCATVIYGLLDKGMWKDNNLRKWHLSYDTPYNTYIRKGFPKSPISNPSLVSLDAAVNPPQTKYLFFVSRNDGTHVFSESYSGHSKAVLEYQIEYWSKKKY